MEATPPQSEPRKRGRPKGSTKAKAEKEKEASGGGPPSKMRGSGGERRNTAADESYAHWKMLVPVLYDWLASHNLVWPSLSCRWGPVLERGTYKNKQRLYLSEQTDHTQPNTLIIANCEVVKPRVAAENHIANFNEDARSPYVKKYKTILHPGEVNRIRELPQNKNIVATHTDCPEVLIWDVEAQPNRHAVLGADDSRPDLVLSGHQDNAEFALAMCPAEPFVLSGGKDKTVVLWSIQDHVSTLATDATQPAAESASSIVKAADNSTVGPRGIFEGHSDTVEDVQFCPSSSQQFCSVGDDSCLILWDARTGTNPVTKVEKAHNADLHCVDWNSHDENYILTGSADNAVCMFDRRNLTSNGVGAPVHKFEGHTAAVLCVQWSPDKRSVFGSSAEDGLLNIWDYEKVGQKEETGLKSPSTPAGLFFQHAGHRDKVVDFHWNAYDPWTIVSVSDDGEIYGGGGTLQLWRMTDLLYRPKDEVLAELQKFKDHVIECSKTS
ncbi:Nucleosome remodeling factor, subunit CAF1/NURF55/MSI1 [Handroanthus impetiginosus]|uniref:Nucleosome remodeling factor, subunit CAF1/NURF55/MSI1 n=1 Tax=Handroanthus impetiginosus TaxID=429701 RepID=A0A2G9I5W0_9LAMI|nr:Nucleosome remodeling factor, subunit CAF1/NURF55/MSI1 [Handroanthus impetiginosus]